MALAIAIVKFITSIPQLASLFEKIMAAYLDSLDAKRKTKIEEATRVLMRAKTKEDRRAALDFWINSGK